jgi:hypothetical protein
MSLIPINRNPSRRQLAVFGATWATMLGAAGTVAAARSGMSGTVVATWLVAAGVPAIGYVYPPFLRLVYVGLACLSAPVGFLISHFVLATVYYLVLTPLGLALRCGGRDPMARHFDRSADTYWAPRKRDERPGRYFRQF